MSGTDTYYTTKTCPLDGILSTAQVFDGFDYLLVDAYLDTDCTTPYTQNAYLASGECEVSGGNTYVIATLFSNRSAKLQYFIDSVCSTSAYDASFITEDLLTSHTCYNSFKFYSSLSGSAPKSIGSTWTASSASSNSTTSGSGSSDSSDASVGLIAGIAVGCIFLLLIAIGCWCWCRRRNRNRNQEQQVLQDIHMRRLSLPQRSINSCLQVLQNTQQKRKQH
ncbi:unnamed protein product [Peronospora belbahrii]|uniref:Uncharacterized protein n=1 Tax=Peronospora belbahrii TaxID=622444 RepID=A0ABN8D9K6_9STRA|nr:unnamed protein product [Peronospora belbahrii]